MMLANVSKLTICPQCGEDWLAAARAKTSRLEFCPRCGSPVTGHGFDPFLRAQVFGGFVRINSRTKFVVRSGVLGIGLLCMLTGFSLFYSGWISPGGLDAVQLWVSRIGGPVLVLQGLMHACLPFRRPAGARIIAFPTTRA